MGEKEPISNYCYKISWGISVVKVWQNERVPGRPWFTFKISQTLAVELLILLSFSEP